jgi:hypothetical protein
MTEIIETALLVLLYLPLLAVPLALIVGVALVEARRQK